MFKFFWVTEDEDQELHEDGVQVEVAEDDYLLEEDVWQIALDVLDMQDNIVIIAPVAGVDLDDVDLVLNKTILTVKWKREQPKEYSQEEVVIRNSECFWWKFIRNVILPENLALNKIKAYMENNLLIITIPKMKFDSKNIKIDKIES